MDERRREIWKLLGAIALGLGAGLYSVQGYCEEQGAQAPKPPNEQEMLDRLQKDGLPSPSEFHAAAEECRKARKGPSCVTKKLKAAGFSKLPDPPEEFAALEECMEKSEESGDPEAARKECFEKHAPRKAAGDAQAKKDSTGTGTTSSSAL